MSSNAARAQRWMDRAFSPDDYRPLAANGNVYSEGDTIFSYGSHFPMAIVMRERPANPERVHWRTRENSPTVGDPKWVLVNGDRYSVSTSGHQAMVRTVIAKSGLPSVIIPFTALRAAGIEDLASIEVLEVRPDRNETIPHSADHVTGEHLTMDDPTGATEDFQVWVGRGEPDADENGYVTRQRPKRVPDPDRRYVSQGSRTVAERSIALDGAETWTWETHRHWLGDSLIRAKVDGRRRRFLSSFDHQEARELYFFCELPRTSKAETVEQAYEDLKPPQVKAAEAQLRTVSRQGDMFAIPTTFTTREVKAMTPHGKGRIVKRPRMGLLGTNHTASEVIFATGDRVYARGLLYHNPGMRDPDHARRKMGDGKTWHLLVKNTVPTQKPRERERSAA